MLVLIFVFLSNAELIFHSPDELAELSLDVHPFNYGKPALYTVYGFLFIAYGSNCLVDDIDSSEEIPVFINDNNCTYTDLAKHSYKAGAKLIMIVDHQTNSTKKKQISYDDEINQPNIIVLLVSEYISDIIKNYTKISVSYTYTLTSKPTPEIQLVLSGDHHMDRLLIKELSQVSNDYNLQYSNVSFSFIYTHNNESINKNINCIFYDQENYCTNNLINSGRIEVLYNLVMSLTFYDTLPFTQDKLDIFLKYMNTYYEACQDDYSIKCHYKILIEYTNNTDYSLGILKKGKLLQEFMGYYIINGVEYPWIGFLESGYCASAEDDLPKCPLCNIECTKQLLNQNNCDSFCNNLQCGFSNLKCLLVQPGCYTFMLGDYNCNANCSESLDCRPGFKGGLPPDKTHDKSCNENSSILLPIILIVVLFPSSGLLIL